MIVFELSFAAAPAPVGRVDPVCRVQVEEAAARVVHGGVAYVFCSAECAGRFAERPDAYLR